MVTVSRVGVGRRGGRDAGALAGAAHAGFGEGQAGAGAAALRVRIAAIWRVGVMGGEAADELDRVLAQAAALGAAAR